MTPATYADGKVIVHHADCLDTLRQLPDNSIDSVVTDPPYGLEFMGKDWDAPWKTGNGFRRADNPADAGRDNMFGRQSKRGPEYIAGNAFQAWCQQWATECHRVLKPGGHLLAFGGTRTYHRLASAIEDAGFEIRDSITWLYGSGFPKSLDVSKAIDKAAGVERTAFLAKNPGYRPNSANGSETGMYSGGHGTFVRPDIFAPATADAETWQGWGTALKPASEPIVVARKPLAGTVAANVLAHGTGALNIDGCRVGTDDTRSMSSRTALGVMNDDAWQARPVMAGSAAGRWPANVVLTHTPGCVQTGTRRVKGSNQAGSATTRKIGGSTDIHGTRSHGTETVPAYNCTPGCPVAELDQQSGTTTSAGGSRGAGGRHGAYSPIAAQPEVKPGLGDTGGASRFFPTFRYQAKAASSERPSDRVNATSHPTVKPLDLMRWLVRLVTPPGGVVLEPFAGSGTTCEAAVLEGMRCIAIEREADYLPLIRNRLTRRLDPAAFLAHTGSTEGTLFDVEGEAS